MSKPSTARTETDGNSARPRTLAEQLRGWPEDRLLALLRDRPDLATPAPQDSAHLASRVGTRASIARALDQLTRTEIAVLDAIALAGPVTASKLAGIVNAGEGAVSSAVDRLSELVLVWDSPGGLRALSEIGGLIAHSTGTSGLQAWSRTPRDQSELTGLIDALTPNARALLTHVVDGGGTATAGPEKRGGPRAADDPVQELIDRGLLLPRAGGLHWVPGEVGLAVRRGKTTVETVDAPPAIAVAERDPEQVNRSAAGAAFDSVRRVEVLLDHWSTHPPVGLRSGGLAVRDLKAASRLIHADIATTALLVEVASAAGLLALGMDQDGNAAWLPTDAYDAWTSRATAQRWFHLVEAWLSSPRLASRVGTKDPHGKTWNALAPDLAAPLQVETRHETLTVLAETPPGAVLAAGTGLSSLVRMLWWRRPRRPAARESMVLWAVSEAGVLGVLGADGMSAAGRALVTGDAADVEAALTPLLPPLVDQVLVQADLTAVAPGPLESATARTLHLLADIESRGGATVYRFSVGSLRRALDAGWSVAEVHDFLDSVSSTPIPQPLTYLVNDAARTFGNLRVGFAESFIRSDDETLIAELMHHPQAANWGLRKLAPTVIVSTTPVAVLLQRLRDSGSAPVVEAADGSVRVARRDLQRTRNPRSTIISPAQRATREAARMAQVAAAIRAGDRAASLRPSGGGSQGPSAALAALRAAVEDRRLVLIGYVDNDGATTERVVAPIRVDGGWLTAYDQRADDHRSFAVHRIVAVRPLEQPA
jgi:hypothetical protein